MTTSSRRGFWALYLSVVLLSANGLFAKLLPLTPLPVTAMRCAIAAIVLAGLIIWRKQLFILQPRRDIAIALGLGVLMGVHWITFFHSLQVSTITIGVLATFTYPVLTVFLEPLWRKEKIQWQDIISGCVVFLGVWLLVPHFSWNSGATQGVIWGVFSGLCLAIRNIGVRHYLKSHPSQITFFWQVLAVAVVFLPFVRMNDVAMMSSMDWWKLLLLGAFFTAIGHGLLAESLRFFSAKTVGLVSCAQPVMAAVMAYFLLNEALTWNIALGGALILGAAVFESLRVSR
ncbi:MAG: DMT family transporter [Gammaproteobacteria bacterium]|nr:DMT family transporter [Gammaproteobacteria bacterium]